MAFVERIESIIGVLPKAEFARKIGVHVSTIATWDDRHLPKGDILQRIHDEFDVNINWLLTGEGEAHLQPVESDPRTDDEEEGLEIERKSFAVTACEPRTGRTGKIKPTRQVSGESDAVDEIISQDELALIRTLRLCGGEYKRRVYVAATVRAQNVLEKKKLDPQERLKNRKELEILSTAAIE